MRFLRPYGLGHIYHADGTLYMERWTVFESKWLSIRIHDIHTEDRDKGMHDHPWWFISIVLRNSYVEQRPLDNGTLDPAYDKYGFYTRRDPGSIAFRHAHDRHLIQHVITDGRPVRTLFIHGPIRNEWGFYVPNRGKVDFKTYLAEKFK
jgi:hypothetical protein